MLKLLRKYPSNQLGLIGHTIIHYPSLELARASVATMVAAGVDLIELQIPFSEPVADGPLFMAANHAALNAGVTVKDCFDFMQECTQRYSIPFVFMSYANIIFQKGFTEFVRTAQQVGARGVIVPDLPPENGKEFLAACRQYDFAAIQVIPPNVNTQRLAWLLQHAQGFVYAVARTGVTGAKTHFDESLSDFVQQIRQHSDLPVAVGFGVSSAVDLQFLKPIADYAVIGSAALRVLQDSGLSALAHFWEELKLAAREN